MRTNEGSHRYECVPNTNSQNIEIPPHFRWIAEKKYNLAISESILQEYMEIIGEKTTGQIAQNIGELLLSLENVEKTEIYFRWNLIQADPDDNKFVDCAISARVRFVVTNDKHFKELKDIEFPPVEVINADDFLEELKKL